MCEPIKSDTGTLTELERLRARVERAERERDEARAGAETWLKSAVAAEHERDAIRHGARAALIREGYARNREAQLADRVKAEREATVRYMELYNAECDAAASLRARCAALEQAAREVVHYWNLEDARTDEAVEALAALLSPAPAPQADAPFLGEHEPSGAPVCPHCGGMLVDALRDDIKRCTGCQRTVRVIAGEE